MLHLPTTPARWPALLFCCLLTLLLPGCSLLPGRPDAAATPDAGREAFALVIEADDDAVRDYLEQHLELQRFRQLPDLQASELTRLLQTADANARELLATLGYFSPDIRLELQDRPAQTPDAPAHTVRLKVKVGPRTRIDAIDISVTGNGADLARRQAQLQRNWGLPVGEPFTQQAWDDAKAQGLRSLQARRYPTARLAESRADIDADQARAQLQVHYDSGPLYRFGALQIRGGERYDSTAIARIALLPTGADYNETKLLDAQQRLAASGYYDAVFLTLDTQGTDPEAAPVIAQVRDAPLQKLVFGIGVSTDSGPRLSMDHIHNRLPGLGWRAVSKVSLDRKLSLVSTDWTALPSANGWRSFTGAQLQREVTGSFDVDSTRLRAGRTQNTDHIDRSYYLQHDTAYNRGPGAPPWSSAISANFGWTGRYFNNNTAPTRGWGLAGEIGLGSTLRPAREPFVRTQLRWQSFIDLGRVDLGEKVRRSSRLSLRLEGGAVLARASADIPVTQLFLTGGDTTVRGYSYRSIGAHINNGQLFGGRYLAVASAEWQRPIVLRGNRTDFESALFVDAGAVADQPGQMSARVGVGGGLRWRSPVGPLQADLGYGLQSHALRLHLRLGYTF
ncbi:MAG: BamA/TamA family outer membrane protein [Proteobacteria bacterium]|nr:BamA/TamA family outer membrane protein [Pseudomonadota bacterium]MBS0493205.1 BamA/TamA family outer membrane protein [Pseudomonadota bacterium]